MESQYRNPLLESRSSKYNHPKNVLPPIDPDPGTSYINLRMLSALSVLYILLLLLLLF